MERKELLVYVGIEEKPETDDAEDESKVKVKELSAPAANHGGRPGGRASIDRRSRSSRLTVRGAANS